jgi:DnaD/phage-associated family protein
MARGRMIASTVATDKRLNSLMAIPHLDRDGLILGDTMPLLGKVCPRRNEFMGHMENIIAEWVYTGLVIAYECDEGTILYFTGFGKNQTGIRYEREAPSAYPVPPDYRRTESGLELCDNEASQTNSGLTPDELRTNSARVGAGARAEVKSKLNKTNTGDGSDWRSVVDAYQQEIGVITPGVSEEIKAYYDEIGAAMLIDAFKEASRNNIRKWSYVDGILKKWKVNGRTAPRDSDGGWNQLNNNLPDYMKEG